MANICNNSFQLRAEEGSEKDYYKVLNTLKVLFEDYFNGDIDYEEDEYLIAEGWFDSKWTFPEDQIRPILENTDVYFRCISEEYGEGYYACNVYTDKEWKEPQYFELYA